MLIFKKSKLAQLHFGKISYNKFYENLLRGLDSDAR
jgi:hypothetical protein